MHEIFLFYSKKGNQLLKNINNINILIEEDNKFSSQNKIYEKSDNYILIKGLTRNRIDSVVFESTDSISVLIGEAYISRKDKTLNSVFLSAEQIHSQFNTREKDLAAIKGNFCFIHIDLSIQQVSLFKSRHGILSLFYSSNNENIVISTNLNYFRSLGHEINIKTIVEQQLFYFPVLNDSLLSDVFQLLPAEKVELSHKHIPKRTHIFDHRNYYVLEKLPYRKSIEIFLQLFYEVTNDLVDDRQNFNVALTAGFDSRSILSTLLRSGKEIQCYAFGPSGMSNIEIPIMISNVLGFRFLPIWLNEDFESYYPELYNKTVYLTDGYLGERCNYPFAYEKLSPFSEICINGNWGSEAIRPFQNFSSLVSKDYYDIVTSKDRYTKFNEIYNRYINNSYIKNEFLKSVKEGIWEDLNKWFIYTQDLELSKQIHIYLYFNNEIKYFANEIQSERMYCTNRYPYHDQDLVTHLFKSSFSGFNKEAFKKRYYSIYKSQKIYYEIIHKYSPSLLKFTTDHGYSPKNFSSPVGLVSISKGYLSHIIRRKFGLEIGFKSHLYANRFYQAQYDSIRKSSRLSEFLSKNLVKDLHKLNNHPAIWRFDIIMSNLIWLQEKNHF